MFGPEFLLPNGRRTKVPDFVSWVTSEPAWVVHDAPDGMNRTTRFAALAVAMAALALPSAAEPFVLFPKAAELFSPDRRLVVRNQEHPATPGELVGPGRSLWLVDLATHRARKLCNYLGVAAVRWSGNDFVLVTEYVTKKTSRAWVFPVAEGPQPVVLDKPSLVRALPAQLRDVLRENDHVFLEASKVNAGVLLLRVWGYGAHDRNGFRWICGYDLQTGDVHCSENPDAP